MIKSKDKSLYDIVIIGGGITGLCLANQLIEKGLTRKIAIIDKEPALGMHTSGRNSGVLHAGIYYKPETLKARVCVEGGKRLSKWIKDRNLPYKQCGKIIVPTRKRLDAQLDELQKRGEANGAKVEMLNESDLRELAPEVRSASGRGLWSPKTSVTKPLQVVHRLQKELKQQGVDFMLNQKNISHEPKLRQIMLGSGKYIYYEHLFNCAGLQADNIAQKFEVGDDYSIMPFKGLYWQVKKKCKVQPKANIYPVPDLNVPFLGVHFTPSADKESVVTIGPTATLAWGREHYKGMKGIEPGMTLRNASILAKQYVLDLGNFRRYVHEQAFLNLPPLLLSAAQELIPSITKDDIELSPKIAIRSQLFNHKEQKLEDDFLCLAGPNSTHILNAISPAFTASFALADLIIERSGIVSYSHD